ncbi:LmeA family phospholipid-binding protein [Kamptonema cortianum]|nr:LmeA family phospholipid-binding protein [Geitlerinema splendidum]MDK3156260.1 LmeA family phospholipid-binding protein [Kamptonema cortianum]
MGLLGLALVVGGGLLAGQEEARFERKAASEIESKLQNVRGDVSVNVTGNGLAAAWGDLSSATITAHGFSLDSLPLFTEPERSRAGKIGTLSLRLSDFTLRKLRIESLDADIPDCRYDFGLAKSRGLIRLSHSGTGVGTVRILEQDLAEYLVKKYHEIKRCTVRVDRGFVWVEGYGEFIIVNSNFTVIAKLQVEDGTKLMLVQPKIYFDWVRTDAFTTGALLKTLNPVVDLREDLGLHDAVYVREIQLQAGVLTASGDTKIPLLPTDNE